MTLKKDEQSLHKIEFDLPTFLRARQSTGGTVLPGAASVTVFN